MYFMIPAKDYFPPHIYYKVFTHRPVQDVGAFSPHDYTSLDFRRQTPRDVHNKTTPLRPVRGKVSSVLLRNALLLIVSVLNSRRNICGSVVKVIDKCLWVIVGICIRYGKK